MNMDARRLMYLCVGSLLVQLSQCGPTPTEGVLKERPARSVLLEVGGHEVGVTYYDPESRNIGDERRSFDVGVLERLGSVLNNIVEDTLIKQKYTVMLAPYSKKLFDLIYSSKKRIDELVETGKSQDFKSTFVKDSMKALREALDSPGDTEKVKAMLKREPREVQQRIKNLLALFKEIVESSPTGLYVDWSKITVDGETLNDIVPAYVKYFKKNGYSIVISMMSPLISAIEKFRM